MVSAYNTPWVICTKYVLSNYFTTLGLVKESYKLSMKRIRYELSLDYENEVERMLSMIDIYIK